MSFWVLIMLVIGTNGSPMVKEIPFTTKIACEESLVNIQTWKGVDGAGCYATGKSPHKPAEKWNMIFFFQNYQETAVFYPLEFTSEAACKVAEDFYNSHRSKDQDKRRFIEMAPHYTQGFPDMLAQFYSAKCFKK